MSEKRLNMSDEELMELIKKSVSEKAGEQRKPENCCGNSREPMEVRWKLSNPDRPVNA